MLDKDNDDAARERALDEDTKLRRRESEMLLLNGGRKLQRWDGLPTDHGAVEKMDGILESLLKFGVLRWKDLVDE